MQNQQQYIQTTCRTNLTQPRSISDVSGSAWDSLQLCNLGCPVRDLFWLGTLAKDLQEGCRFLPKSNVPRPHLHLRFARKERSRAHVACSDQREPGCSSRCSLFQDGLVRDVSAREGSTPSGACSQIPACQTKAAEPSTSRFPSHLAKELDKAQRQSTTKHNKAPVFPNSLPEPRLAGTLATALAQRLREPRGLLGP